MADLQISQLTELAEADLAALDELAIVDGSASETKRITAKALVEKGVALIDAGSIPGTALASLGTDSVVTASITDGNVTNAKLENSSFNLGGLSISLGSSDLTPALDLTDATNYPASSLTGTITNAQLAGSIANNKLANSSISLAGVSINLGDTNATPTFDLTNATNYPASSLVGTVSNAQLAGSIANSKLVNSSINIGGVTFNLGDSDTSPALDLSDATNYPTSSLSGTITNAQLAGSIQGSKLVGGSVTSTELGTNSVTANELADLSVDTAALIDSSVTNDKISAVSGTKITGNTIPASALNTSNIDRSLDVSNGSLGIANVISAGQSLGISYNAQGLITAAAGLSSSDLPISDASNIGGVSIPSGSGLSVTGAGALSLTNAVTATTVSGIEIDSHGLVVSITSLTGTDLPTATTSDKGAVIVQSGGGLQIDGSGNLTTALSGIAAGTYQSVTVNTKGIVTAGQSLTASDIPNISATKLTSGTLDIGRFATNSITGQKLADSSVCQFTGATSTSGVVTFPTAEYKGQFFYDLTNDDLYVYDGSAFQPVTITSGEIIYAGNYRADTNKITSLSAAGTAQGFTLDGALVAASSANNRYYFVCDKSGTGTSPAPTVTINPPDMILSNGNTWEKLDISNFIAGQSASNISVSPSGGIQNTNVQSVLEELDNEKLNLSGGTMTGVLNINENSSIVFEGSTPDDFETTLTIIDATQDNTLSLPNVTGTLVSTGDSGSVTSTMIADGTILNSDINSSAAIALGKLAAVSPAQILVGASSTGVITAVGVTGDISIDAAGLVSITADSIVNADIKSDAQISGSKIIQGTTSVVGVIQLEDSVSSASTTKAATPASVKTVNDALTTTTATANAALPKAGGTLIGNLIVDNAKQIRFTEADANGAHYVSLQAPDTLAADTSYTLPSALPTANGQVLASTTGGVLSWTEDPTGGWVTSGDNISYSAGDVTFTGASYNLVWDKSANALEFADNAKLKFGAIGDLEIWHSSSQNQSYIKDGGAGGLIVEASLITFTDAADSSTAFTCDPQGATTLRHNSSAKLSTSSTGATVTGTLVADGLTVDTNTLHVDATNNRVGIGVTNPANELVISKAGSAANCKLEIAQSGGGGGTSEILFSDSVSGRGRIFFDHGSNPEVLNLEAAGTIGLSVTTAGRVGISTSSPEGKVHIENASSGATYSADSSDLVIIENSDSVGIDFRSPAANSANILFSDANARGQGRICYEHNNDALFFTTAGVSNERMRITSAGKIGINEDDPDGDLQVTTAGSAHAQLKVGGNQSTGNGMKITYSNSGNTSTIFKQNYHATNAGALMQFDSGLFYFRTGTGPTTALTIDSSQRVGIGTTNLTVPLNVLTTGNDAAIFESTSGNEHGVQVTFRSSSASPADNDKLAVLDFSGKDDAGNNTTYAQIRSHSRDVTNNSEDGDITFHTRVDGAFAERMRLNSSGLLSIGDDPAGAATYGGDVVIANTDGGILTLADTVSGERLRIEGGAGFARIGTESNHDLVFFTNGTGNERMRIDSSGRILAGVTSSTETNERLNITHPTNYSDNIVTFSTQPNDTIGNANVLNFRDKVGISSKIVARNSAYGSSLDNALQFYTSTSSNNAPTLALTIDESQNATFAGHLAIGSSTTKTDIHSSWRGIQAYNHSYLWGYASASYPAVHLTNNARPTSASFTSGWKRDVTGTYTAPVQVEMYHGNFNVRTADNDVADSDISWDTRFTVKQAGDVEVKTGNLVIGTAGKGIDFSATSDATGKTSELLDAYEEGTWTGAVQDGSGVSIGINNVACRYTKIGRQVTCWFNITRNETGSRSGVISWAASLPFTTSNDISVLASGTWWLDEGGPSSGDSIGGAIYLYNNATSGRFVHPTSPAQQATNRYLQYSEWSQHRSIYGSFTYFV